MSTKGRMKERNERTASGFVRCAIAAASLLAIVSFAGTVLAQQPATSAGSNPPAASSAAPPGTEANLPGENQEVYSDPLAPFNESMFTFNLKLDDWVLRPVAKGYSYIAPQPVRESVGRFFDNYAVIPRFTNNLFQGHLPEAGGEVARFGINTVLGLGFFDPADTWFGLKEHPNDFGLTLRYYGVPAGAYLMLPILGPSTVTDAIGYVVDVASNPLTYITYYTDMPWYGSMALSGGIYTIRGVNYRSLHIDQFEEADRYAVDLYGAVQDFYLQSRENRVKELKQE
jgi:phospholipid-binding lipoprotein MlaA